MVPEPSCGSLYEHRKSLNVGPGYRGSRSNEDIIHFLVVEKYTQRVIFSHRGLVEQQKGTGAFQRQYCGDYDTQMRKY